MSIKNIVTGQLASVTSYDPTTAQVTGLSLGTGNLQLAGNLISTTSSVITIDPLDDGTGAGNVVVLGNMSVTGTLSYNNLSNTTTSNLTWIAASDAVSNSAATGGGLQVGLDNGVYATWLYNQPSNVWSASLGVSAPYFVGDGANLTNITVAAGTQIVNGSSSVAVAALDGNIVFGVNGAQYGQLGTANTVMIGYEVGAAGTAEGAVALGKFAGYSVGNANITAVGTLAGSLNARANSVSIGVGAGWGNVLSGGGTGLNSIAIGAFAARAGSANNTIILNATGANLNGVAAQANSFYVAPIRSDNNSVTGNTSYSALVYNSVTSEITRVPASIPTFSATSTATISVGADGASLVIYNVEDYDSDNWFLSSRYTPQRAGWYQFNGGANINIGAGSSVTTVQLRKNSARVSQNGGLGATTGSTSRLVYMNGTTDYVEVYISSVIAGSATQEVAVCFFNGYWVRP